MIFALRQPAILLGLLLGFLVGIPLRGAAQRALARPGGLRRSLRPVSASRRSRQSWTAYIDPFGAVAAVLSGVGWGVRPESSGRRSAGLGPLLAALIVHGLLAAAGLAVFVANGGTIGPLADIGVVTFLHGSIDLGRASWSIELGFAMENLACGLLALLPIPPLELGVFAWSRFPRTPGARRVAFHLLEEHWGVAAVLILVLLPLGGGQPAALELIDVIGKALLRAV